VQGQAWYNVSRVCTGGQQRNVKHAHVGRVHSVAIGKMGNDGHGIRKDVCCWCRGCEKMTRGTRVEDGPPSDCVGICGNHF
jgi:hypothetical protein